MEHDSTFCFDMKRELLTAESVMKQIEANTKPLEEYTYACLTENDVMYVIIINQMQLDVVPYRKYTAIGLGSRTA